MKKYKLGMVCGRFGHIHKGHQIIVNEAIKKCEKTLILVGSSQESNTLRNPFSADFRIELIQKIYNKPDIKIKKLPDMTNEYDITEEWGDYVINKVIEYEGKFANLIVSGNDEERRNWFSRDKIKDVKEIIIDRDKFKISATKLRGYILLNDKKSWSKYVAEEIINDFEKIREKLLEVDIYKQILEQMRKENAITIENFIKIYTKYEKEDKKIKVRNI